MARNQQNDMRKQEDAHCHDPRHGKPCPFPCVECEETCDPDYFYTSGEGCRVCAEESNV